MFNMIFILLKGSPDNWKHIYLFSSHEGSTFKNIDVLGWSPIIFQTSISSIDWIFLEFLIVNK